MPAYKEKTKNTWYVSFYFTDWTGTRKRHLRRGFKRQKDALEYDREFLVKQQGSPDMLFSSLYDLYQKDGKARVKETTITTRDPLFKKHILPYLGNMPINKITPADIRAWQNQILQATYISKKIQRKYSPTYINVLHVQLSAIFNYAVTYYRLPSNPAKLAGSIGKTKAHAMKFWTIGPFNQFISSFPADSTEYLVFNLLFYTGMRSEELLALTLSDFYEKEKSIHVNKTYSRLYKKDIVTSPKTEKGNRVILLPQFIVDMLADYINRLPYIKQNERIFPCSKFWLFRHMKLGCKLSGVEQIRIHDLRHSHASLLIEMGFSPLLIKERLGHEDIKITLQTYSHLYLSKQEELTAKLNDIGRNSIKTVSIA